MAGSETQYNDATSAGMFEAVRSVAGERLKWVVVTRGMAGADAYAASSDVHVDAVAADQIDATGAGDAFTVGMLHGLLQGNDMGTALQLGAAWGAATVAQLRSIPVPWEELAGPFHSQATLGLLAADAIERDPRQFSGLQARARVVRDSRPTEAPGPVAGQRPASLTCRCAGVKLRPFRAAPLGESANAVSGAADISRRARPCQPYSPRPD